MDHVSDDFERVAAAAFLPFGYRERAKKRPANSHKEQSPPLSCARLSAAADHTVVKT